MLSENFLFVAFLVLTIISCQSQEIGDIPFDESTDDPTFQLCNEYNIKQYYVRNTDDSPAGYLGEKRALTHLFKMHYFGQPNNNENGYLTVRFIVNCKGETGRYRIEEMDFEYHEKKFSQEIVHSILYIIKNANIWIPVSNGNTVYDYYQYLTFKIENGQIKEIMP